MTSLHFNPTLASARNTNALMSEQTSPRDYKRWTRLLHVPNTTTSELYDADQGVRQCVLRVFGFHDEYLSYSSSKSTQGKARLKGEGHNWSSVSRVWRAVRTAQRVKLIHWTYDAFQNQLRMTMHNAITPNTTDPCSTHARGVFIDKGRRLFVVYEPRAFDGVICQWFGSSLNDFAKAYKSYSHLIIYGNQTTTSDCEKRVIRFGVCCWEKFRSSERVSPTPVCRCSLCVTHTALANNYTL
jgi:hypothetical protein